MELSPENADKKESLSSEIETYRRIEQNGDITVSETLQNLITKFINLKGTISSYRVPHQESQYEVGQVLDTIPSDAIPKNV